MTTVSAHAEAPLTLDQPAAKALGFFDQVGLWGNLGVSLLGFTGALFVLQPRADSPGLSVAAALLATFVGTALGAAAVGLAAVLGARTGAPSMVLLRGLFGARLSYLPTGLNILQLVGWGTFEIVIISSAAHQLWPTMPQNGYVVIAGVITTALALRPLGVVRVLRKYVTAAVAIVVVYLFVQLLRHPVPAVQHSSWRNFWPGVDIALAVAISWVPVAADYSRHSKSGRTAFGAAFVGYTITQTACYALGIIAILSVPAAGDGSNHGVWGAFIAVFLGKAAFAVLAIREIDQSFCDVYSTAVSTQNLRPHWDRRVIALIVGTAATLLALVFHIANYSELPVSHRLGVRTALRCPGRRLLRAARASRLGRRRGGAVALAHVAALGGRLLRVPAGESRRDPTLGRLLGPCRSRHPLHTGDLDERLAAVVHRSCAAHVNGAQQRRSLSWSGPLIGVRHKLSRALELGDPDRGAVRADLGPDPAHL